MQYCFSLIALLLLGSSHIAYACSCSNELIANRMASSEFVASIKILDSTPDTLDEEYHDLDIEVLELFKGESLTKIKVWSSMNSSCAFLPQVGSNWIVFARRYNGKLSFGFCSGNVDLDPNKWKNYPKAFANNSRSVQRKLNFLRFIRDNDIQPSNDYHLSISPGSKFKGYKGTVGEFALYSFRVGKDLKIKKMSELKAFKDPKLARATRKTMKRIDKAFKHRTDSIPTESVVSVGLFFYDSEGENQSFVSIFDL